MKKQNYPCIKLLTVALFLIFTFYPNYGNSQIDLKKIKDKAGAKINNKNKDATKEETSKETNSNNAVEEVKPANNEPDLKAEVKMEQEQIMAGNKLISDKYTDDYEDVSIPAYLTFTNDFTKPDANITSFSGTDYIYAKLNMDKPLTELLPDENASGLQYYRVLLSAKTKDNSGESTLKLSKMAHFKLAYGKKDLMIAVVPEKDFYESIVMNYQKEGKSKIQAYDDVLSRNFSSMIANMFSYLPVGEHRVEVEFKVTAKLRSDQYYSVKNMKGVFVINIDEQAKARFAQLKPELSALYTEYEKTASLEESTQEMKKEDEMLAKMTAAEKEKYFIEKYNSRLATGTGGDNDFKVTIKNQHTGLTYYIIQTNLSSMSETIREVQPNQSIDLSCYKGTKYRISAYRQDSSKENARNLGEVDQSFNGKTLIVN